MSTTSLVILFAAFILLYGAIKNRNPLDVIKAALTQKPLTGAKKIQN